MAMCRQTKYGIGAVAAAALAAGVLSGCAGVPAGASAGGVTQVTPAATAGSASALALPVGSTTAGEGTGGVAGTTTNTGASSGSTTGTGTGVGTGIGTETDNTGSGSGSPTHTALPVCAPSGLAATVFVVNGSQGMGHELLNISLININDPTCTLYGFPGFQLMGEDASDQPGADQPTSTLWDTGSPKTLITLAPAQEASTTARIDDDIPAGGEPASGSCEPDSYYLGITPPNDTSQVVQRIDGPMATTGVTVCEHGTFDVLPFVAGPVGPNQ